MLFKNPLIPLLVCMLLSNIAGSFSQSVFRSNDFATLDDSFIVSKISMLDIPNYNYSDAGAGITWDYSSFNPVSQEYKRFTDPDYTGFRAAYIFSCNSLCYLGCYDNCVNSGGFPLICAGSCNFSCGTSCLNDWFTKFDLAELASDSINLIITTIEDVFNFYDITQSALSQVALGAKLSRFPIVLDFQSSDRIYKFPLQYGNADTSFSNYSLQLDSIPGSGIAISFLYNHRQQRYNHVEGWGTLKTPYGVFDSVIKLKAVITSQDTVFMEGTAIPLNIISQSLVEYSWFSPEYGIPLLKVTARVLGGTTIYQSLEYIDSLRCFDPFAVFGYQPFPATINQGEDSVQVGFFSLSVNGDNFTWDFGDSASSENTATGSDAFHVYEEGGVYTVQLVTCNAACSSPICDTFSLPVLILDLSDDTATGIIMLPELDAAAYPNPFADKLLIHVKSGRDEKLKLDFYDVTGKPVYSIAPLYHSGHPVEADLSGLPAGVYLGEAKTGSNRKVFKLIKTIGN